MANPPKVVARADVGEQTRQEITKIADGLARTTGATREIPKLAEEANKAAAKAQEQGRIDPKHQEGMRTADEVADEVLSVGEEEAETDAHDRGEVFHRSPPEPAGGQALRDAESLIGHSPRFNPFSSFLRHHGAHQAPMIDMRRLVWGRSRTVGGWAASGPMEVVNRLQQFGQGIKYMALAGATQAFMNAPHVAEETEHRLSVLASRTGLVRQDVFSSETNPLFRKKEIDQKGMHHVRNALTTLRRQFLMTGDEMLALWESAGEIVGPNNMVKIGRDGASMVRTFGLAPERVGAYLKHMHQRVDTPARRPKVELALRLGGATGGGFAAFFRASQNERYLTQDGMRVDLSGAMAYAGMTDRPEMFLDDLESYTSSLADGVGVVEDRTALGFTALLDRITGAAGKGGGGEAWRPTGQAIIRGAQQHGDPLALSMKLQAVRHFLGPTTIGAGKYAKRWDPESYRGGMALAESGDPKVIGSFVRFAKHRARRMGGSDQDARLIFGKMMNMGIRDVEVLWPWASSLDHARDLTANMESRPWQDGPLFKGKDGTTERSIGRRRAEVDEVQHYAGRAILDIATNIKEAVKIAADGFPSSMIDGIQGAINHLSPRARAILGAHAVAQGNTTAAAVFFGKGLIEGVGTQMVQKWGVPVPHDPFRKDSGDLPPPSTNVMMPGEIQGYTPGDFQGPLPTPVRDAAKGDMTRKEVEDWAKFIGVPFDDLMTALVVASETGEEAPREEALGIAHTLHNRDEKGDFWQRAVGKAGTLGAQGERPYSTARGRGGKSLRWALGVAEQARRQQEAGYNMGGIENFFHPRAQNHMHAKAAREKAQLDAFAGAAAQANDVARAAEYTLKAKDLYVPLDAASVHERWTRTMNNVGVPGADPGRIRFYAPR